MINSNFEQDTEQFYFPILLIIKKNKKININYHFNNKAY